MIKDYILKLVSILLIWACILILSSDRVRNLHNDFFANLELEPRRQNRYYRKQEKQRQDIGVGYIITEEEFRKQLKELKDGNAI